jgi:hypothetical protein
MLLMFSIVQYVHLLVVVVERKRYKRFASLLSFITRIVKFCETNERKNDILGDVANHFVHVFVRLATFFSKNMYIVG